MVKTGILSLTTHSLDDKQALQVLRFKSALKRLFEELGREDSSFIKEVGIEDGVAFDNRLAELRGKDRDKDEEAEMNDMVAKVTKLNGLRVQQQSEEADLKGFSPIPYSAWRKLCEENRNITIKDGDINVELLTVAEFLLEGVLWEEV